MPFSYLDWLTFSRVARINGRWPLSSLKDRKWKSTFEVSSNTATNDLPYKGTFLSFLMNGNHFVVSLLISSERFHRLNIRLHLYLVFLTNQFRLMGYQRQ